MLVRLRFALVVAVGGLLAACGSSAPTVTDDDPVPVYAAAISEVVGDVGAVDAPVFVAMQDDARPLSLDVQARVAHQLDGRVRVRFVDERDEALSLDVPLKPVDGRMLVLLPSLGDVVAEDATIELERYVDVNDRQLVTVRLNRAAEGWTATVVSSAPATG